MSTSEVPTLPRPRPALDRPTARDRTLPPVSAEVWALVGLVVVAAVIRIITIDNQSFWMDESLTAYEARLPFGAMLHTVAHIETTPPLYFVLTWAWAKIFGTGEVALRSISTIAGTALVPIAYLSAKELFSRWAGVIAAALVAVNPFLIWFSQEARAYMLLAALSGATFLWFIRALADPSRRHLGWWVACSALAMMTHFFAGFIVAPEALWLLWRHRQRVVVAAVAAVAVVQLAMLPFAVIDTGQDTGHPELNSKIVYQRCYITNSVGAQSTSNFTTDPDGHGTDVSGIAAAATNNSFGFTGAGGDVSLMAYRIFPTPDDGCLSGSGGGQCGASTLDLASAIDDAVAHGANVISMSLGGGQCSNGQDNDPTEGAALANAIAANVVVVAAAGNSSGPPVEAPACVSGVLAVGATSLADGGANGSGKAGGTPSAPIEYVTSYTDYGSPGEAFGSAAAWGIVAPGGDPGGDG